MAENNDLEQKIKLTYITNADDTAKEVNALDYSIEKTTDSQAENIKKTKENSEAYKSFKTQIREAQQELLKISQKYGETSKEAVNAAKKVADLKDQMQFSKDLVDGFNPDRKFQSLASAANIAATAAAGVTAGMALFGGQNEEVEKTLLKVQAAMAFSESIGKITELGDDFKKLKSQVVDSLNAIVVAQNANTVATEASTVATEAGTVAEVEATVAVETFTAAWWLSLLPIVALTAAIGAVVAAIGYFTGAWGDYSGKAEQAAKLSGQVNAELENLQKTVESNNKSLQSYNNYQLELAKASGKSAKEIRDLEDALAVTETNEARRAVERADRAQQQAIQSGDEETINKATEVLRKMEKLRDDAFQRELDLGNKHHVEVVQAQTDANNKLLEEQKKAEEQRKADLKKHLEELAAIRKKDLEELARVTEESINENSKKYMTALEAELFAIDLKYKTQLALFEKYGKDSTELEIRINNEKAIAINEAKKKTEEELAQEQKDILDAATSEIEAKDEAKAIKDQELHDLKLQRLQELSDAYKKVAADYGESTQAGQIAAIAADLIDEQLTKGKISRAKLAASGLMAASALAGKATSTGKALAVAATTIDTIQSGISAFKGMTSSIPGPVGLALGAVAAAAAVASGFASVKKILAVKVPDTGGAGGGAGGGVSMPSLPTSTAPQVSFQASSENQIATTIADNTNKLPPVKAFVVSSDVTTGQALDRNAINKNSI